MNLTACIHLLLVLLSTIPASPQITLLPKGTKRIPTTRYHGQPHLETLSWAVKFQGPTEEGREYDKIARQVGEHTKLTVQGVVGDLEGHYVMSHKLHNYHHSTNTLLTVRDSENPYYASLKTPLPGHWTVEHLDQGEWSDHVSEVDRLLNEHPMVEWHMQQVVHSRQKRSLNFKDPSYPDQWHLHNINEYNQEHNIHIVKVWERNITGRGVTVAVIDDGLEWTNPDLAANYDPEGSYDLNGNDRDPMPSTKDKKNHHGTRCAGEIAAVANDVCGVGVAYEAGISGIKVLDGPMTDSLEAAAFTKALKAVDVYSCSWGPDDDGKTVDGPHHLAVKALEYAVEYGRKGYGSIFVVASGNGGREHDNCNFDGYANSIYTVTIGAVNELGEMPYYAEECASMLAVTYSSGRRGLHSIVTTDWTQAGGTGCTKGHTGTSAAAPLAAGMIALMLQARSCLTWRDIQHIIVMAAVKVDIDIAHWTRNKAGFHHSPKHGFGIMHAWRLVATAKAWNPVPFMTYFTSEVMKENKNIPAKGKKLALHYTVTKERLDGHSLYTLEYVHLTLTLTLTDKCRGDLEIWLKCPSGTSSMLAAMRKKDRNEEGFKEWTFSTVRCWGETPEGAWRLTVQDKGSNVTESRGVLVWWQLKLYGSPMSPDEVQERKRLVNKASDGRYLHDNYSRPCPPPPLRNKPFTPLSQKTLKILMLLSGFCFVLGVYETVEYILCYGDEKKKFYDELQAATEARTAGQSSSKQQSNPEEGGEGAQLLEEPRHVTGEAAANGVPLRNHTADMIQNSSTELSKSSQEPLNSRPVMFHTIKSKVFQNLSSIFRWSQPYHYESLTQDVANVEDRDQTWLELEPCNVSEGTGMPPIDMTDITSETATLIS